MLYKAFVVALVATLATPALAARWDIIPRVASEGMYDSNAALISGNEVDGYSAKVTAGFRASRNTERTRVYFDPRISVRRFLENALNDLDSESYYVNTGIDHQTERSRLGIRGRFSQRPAFRSEIDDAIPDDPDDPLLSGAGELRLRDDKQNNLYLQSYWDLELSRRDTLSLSGRYSDVSYDESGAITGRSDYSRIHGTLEWARELTPTGSATFGVFVGEFSSNNPLTGASSDSNVRGAEVGYRWRTSKTSTVIINVGATKTDSTSFSGNVRWRKRGETTTLNASISRNVRGTSIGSLRISNEARLFVDRRLSERLTLTMGLVGFKQEELDNSVGGERDYITAEARARWRFARRWAVTAGYRFAHGDSNRNLIDGRDDFNNHQLRLGIAWERQYRP